jgi:hypothetical protein
MSEVIPQEEGEIFDVDDVKEELADDNTPEDITPEQRVLTTTVSYSKLRMISVSGPKTYYERYILKEKSAMTDSQILGIAVHKELLEPDSFKDDFITIRKLDKRKTADKQLFLETVERATKEKKLIIQENALERVQLIAESVRSHPLAKRILDGALTEVEMRWQKTARCKKFEGKELVEKTTTFNTVAYVDIINPAQHLLSDLKVVDGMFEPHRFRNKAKKEFYHAQSALYLEGAEENGIDASRFKFILASAKKPYDVAVLTANQEFLEHGNQAQLSATNRLYSCLLNDDWISYPDEIELDYARF